MKRLAFLLTAVLLATVTIAAGCAAKPPAPAAPTTPPPAASVEGTITAVNPSQGTVTVETDQGRTQTFNVGSGSVITYAGKACTLQELADQQAKGGELTCTVVYDTGAEGEVITFSVVPQPDPASVKGTITGVDPGQSKITVKTAQGDKVYDIDPDTGIILGGKVCSLDELKLFMSGVEGASTLPCTVIYTTDEAGSAVFVDVALPPNATSVTGTLTSVDVPKSTVTIQTDKGPRTFEVDPKTGILLGGEVCSLDEAKKAEAAPGSLNCTVVYFPDESGQAVFIDISQPTK